MGAVFQLVGNVVGMAAEGDKNTALRSDNRDQQLAEAKTLEQADRATVDATDRGRYAAGIARMKGSQLVAEQRLAAANSGADTQSGTPANLMADTRLMSELDVKQIQNNAVGEAWGHRQEAAASKQRRATLQRKATEIDQGALTSFIGSAAKGLGIAAGAGMKGSE